MQQVVEIIVGSSVPYNSDFSGPSSGNLSTGTVENLLVVDAAKDTEPFWFCTSFFTFLSLSHAKRDSNPRGENLKQRETVSIIYNNYSN